MDVEFGWSFRWLGIVLEGGGVVGFVGWVIWVGLGWLELNGLGYLG